MDDVKRKMKVFLNSKNNKIIIKVLIILIFVYLTCTLGVRHEHWSDEAQSFLLARDTNVSEIFYYMRYEGTPPLWVYVIKLFLFLGGTYKTLYLLPIIFSMIGLIIFEFKLKIPWYIKLIFPFTYFIFYQYTIVARSYCLIFPVLMMIALIYNNRHKKPFLYAFFMYLLMNISLHTLAIAGALFLLDVIDYLVLKKKNSSKKILYAGILLLIMFAVTVLITFPALDCVILPKSETGLFHILAEATIGSGLNKYLEMLIGIIIMLLLVYKLNNFEKTKVLILLLPVLLVLLIIRFQVWYTGIIWILMLFIFVINDKINSSKLVKLFVLCVCLVQSYWTVCSFCYDYNNSYSGSRETAKYLKKFVNEDKLIYGVGFSKTAIQPYFKKNIFANKLTDKTFHIWARDSKELVDIELINNDVSVFIISEMYQDGYPMLMKFLDSSGYKKTKIKGYTYIKNHVFESESYIIYEK